MSSLDNIELSNMQQTKLKKCKRVTNVPQTGDVARVNKLLDKELCEQLLEEIKNKKDFNISIPHGKNRYEQYVNLDNPVYKKALDMVMTKLNAKQLHTFTIAFSEPGSETQPLHRDFTFPLPYKTFNAIIALEDMKEEYGATMFIPETNKATWYEQYEKNGKVIELPYIQEILNQGDAMVHDTDVLHCGTANKSNKTRISLMVAFVPDK